MELTDFQSFERLTGLAFFTPAGAAASIHLGNVTMMRCDYGLASVDIMRSRRGIVSTRKRHYFQRAPVFTIETNQFVTAIQALHLAGTKLADLDQDAQPSGVFTFTAVPGGAWDIGRGELWSVSVHVGADTKTPDYDYTLDAYNGWIWLPTGGGTIVAGDIVGVVYSSPNQRLEQYSAFDTLSQAGQLVVFAEDEFGPAAREKWVMSAELCVHAMSDTAPDKFRTGVLEATIYGTPTVYKRPQPMGFAEIVLDDGSILDLS